MFEFHVLMIFAMLFIGYVNGANDNFKGVATLFGSGAANYDQALRWATVTTVAGSLTSLFLATRLISIFQGNGLVPRSVAESEPFLCAVILAASVTVLVATQIGMPVSTTHSITGALLGAGLIATGLDLGFHTLLSSFFLPLLASPAAAVIVTLAGFRPFMRSLRAVGLTKQNCVCVHNPILRAPVTPEGYVISESAGCPRIVVGSETECVQKLEGRLIGVNGQKLLDLGHFLSAGAVSFARGLNDTPKIVALALVGSTLDLTWAIILVVIAMTLGGLVSAGKVAETVSKRITGMDPDHGLLANLVTSFLVVVASRWGLPVSTTHVSCGALFGIGMANGQAQWSVIRVILLAWLTTLPFAGISAGLLYWFLVRSAGA
jgi:PiT family inorganic phosphate transporter